MIEFDNFEDFNERVKNTLRTSLTLKYDSPNMFNNYSGSVDLLLDGVVILS